MSALTPKQQQIYDFILSFSGRHGYPCLLYTSRCV